MKTNAAMRSESTEGLKIKQYEAFLQHSLLRDLSENQERKDNIRRERVEYELLRRSLEALQKNELDQLCTLVDLGSQIFVQGNVDDMNSVFVDIGLGFHVQCTLDEAIQVCSEREEFLAGKEEILTNACGNVRANVRAVVEAMKQLQDIQGDELHQ